ncbi:unnamed protein product [Rodentolepis nana]|uniref:Cystatin domain-containing protein n=1 Tax=Rodentolepis nana TaxID=102285 RepID=A0A0R3T8P0_RODNA|nr:unnamed protein product [Rodentolepis nana]
MLSGASDFDTKVGFSESPSCNYGSDEDTDQLLDKQYRSDKPVDIPELKEEAEYLLVKTQIHYTEVDEANLVNNFELVKRMQCLHIRVDLISVKKRRGREGKSLFP